MSSKLSATRNSSALRLGSDPNCFHLEQFPPVYSGFTQSIDSLAHPRLVPVLYTIFPVSSTYQRKTIVNLHHTCIYLEIARCNYRIKDVSTDTSIPHHMLPGAERATAEENRGDFFTRRSTSRSRTLRYRVYQYVK